MLKWEERRGWKDCKKESKLRFVHNYLWSHHYWIYIQSRATTTYTLSREALDAKYCYFDIWRYWMSRAEVLPAVNETGNIQWIIKRFKLNKAKSKEKLLLFCFFLKRARRWGKVRWYSNIRCFKAKMCYYGHAWTSWAAQLPPLNRRPSSQHLIPKLATTSPISKLSYTASGGLKRTYTEHWAWDPCDHGCLESCEGIRRTWQIPARQEALSLCISVDLGFIQHLQTGETPCWICLQNKGADWSWYWEDDVRSRTALFKAVTEVR